MPSPERLRIALFTYSTQPRGGVLHALELAQALHDAGHAVVLHALDDTGRGFIRHPRCPYVLVPVAATRVDFVSFVRRRIAAYVDAWDSSAPAFDVYHAHDGISGNALATLAERRAIPHFDRTVHHLDDFDNREIAMLQDRSIQLARGCFVVSTLWAERVAATYAITAQVVPNGVDCARFSPVAPVERTRLRVMLGYGRGPLFVTIGGIEARKNTLATLNAFALVSEKIASARLIIAGGASIFTHCAYRAAFEARVAELGLADKVIVTGVLPDERIIELLRAAHAFVFPSLIEGFGLVLLEALACATPVITSALPPFNEFLSPRAALMIDPRDPSAIAAAMLRLLEPSIAAKMALLGIAVARRFSWQASAAAHARAYAAVGGARGEVIRA